MDEEKARKVFDMINALEKGDLEDRMLAFDAIGILGNELTSEPYESRLEIVEEMILDHLAQKGK